MTRPVSHTQSGFTLIELAVVVVIIGFLLAGSLALLKPYLDSIQRNATQERLDQIALSLSDFAQQHGRLPCPANPDEAVAAEPFGAPRGSGVLGDNLDAVCGGVVNAGGALGNFIGIVPFRALGLDQDAVRDGYGRYITYAVSPVMAGRDADSQGEVNDAHAQCRQSFWMDEAGNNNLNPRNALLCCPRFDSGNNNLVVRDAAVGGNSLFTPAHSTTVGDYADVNILVGGVPANNDTQLIAFTLISHGKNARGAYSGIGAAQFPGVGVASADETENSDGDTDFVDHPLVSVQNNTYFDDIVVWRTNHQLVSAFGNDSCARP